MTLEIKTGLIVADFDAKMAVLAKLQCLRDKAQMTIPPRTLDLIWES
jgi:hypothetical protein